MKQEKVKKGMQGLFLVILILYPLRHINWGLDLWDTGYNYANFQYMGLEHMDSMWLFSTYLANVTGNFLSRLPFAENLVAMNLYTGLFVSLLAVMGFWFCVKKLEIPITIAFVGEVVAISLCWCPTALLYNYLTYVLFLSGVILLYLGLTKERAAYLFCAGICLGTNILVRFSNLPEAGLIVAVWAYAFWESRDRKRSLQQEKVSRKESAWMRGSRNTLWCMGGYLTALLVLLGWIHVRYGVNQYVAAIQRLFAMTENATDYKAESMLLGIVYAYLENLYWVIRIGCIVAAGMVLCLCVDYFSNRFLKKAASLGFPGVDLGKVLQYVSRMVCIFLAAAMVVWLYWRGFCSFQFYSYDSILRPGILFLMLTMLIALIRILDRNCPREEKLISCLLILVVLLTAIGSNNGVYPSFNNLFVAAPYTFWQCYKFAKGIRELKAGKMVCSPWAAKCILAAFLALFFLQSTLFGAVFVFEEATGVRDISATVANNDTLAGVKMNPERAQWMTEISAYVEEKELKGREVILYGQIPSLSYYLQMPAAFNSWSDLRSYSVKQMELDLCRLEAQIQAKECQLPVIIAEKAYGSYVLSGREGLQMLGVDEKRIQEMEQDKKWMLITDFMERHGYKQTFSNEKFVIWRNDSEPMAK